MKIVLIPVGETDSKLLIQLADSLKDIFGCGIEIKSGIDIPANTYNKKRNQYNSSKLLSVIKKTKPGKNYKVLGVTEADLFAGDLQFVFGQAEVSGISSIISLTRLRQEFYGQNPDDKLLMERAIKEAVHELGHNLGLEHCTDSNCVMHFSNNLHDTDIKSSFFCPRCQPKLIK